MARRPLWGEEAPLYFGVDERARFVSREDHYGFPTLLLLIGREALTQVPSLLPSLRAALPALFALETLVYAVVDQSPLAVSRTIALPDGVGILECDSLLQHCAVPSEAVVLLLLDRGQRVLMQGLASADPELLGRCADLIEAQPALPAPVIVRPGLLPGEWCEELISFFESSPTMEGEVARVDAQGRRVSVVDRGKKRRRDMAIAEGTPLHATLVDRLFPLCWTEIARAFQLQVTYIDRVLLARYDAGAGWFRRHRDNTAEQVAFREFALSVNLNTGAYDGGDLVFPEYNAVRYAPPVGGGLIFSASILHEVLPVSAGSRYALLTFLHSEAAESRRLARRVRAEEAV